MAEILTIEGLTLRDGEAHRRIGLVESIVNATNSRIDSAENNIGEVINRFAASVEEVNNRIETGVEDVNNRIETSVEEVNNRIETIENSIVKTADYFGVIGDGETDDTNAIQEYLNYCHANNKGAIFERKTYCVRHGVITIYSDVDFNGSTFKINDGDLNDAIFRIAPDVTETVQITHADISPSGVNATKLHNKVFSLDTPISIERNVGGGYADFEFVFVTDCNGKFVNTAYPIDIVEGKYNCLNVHEKANNITVKNACFDYSLLASNDRIPCAIVCNRSNVKISGITAKGQIQTTNWAGSIIKIHQCAFVEVNNVNVEHIVKGDGVGSGYILLLSCVSDVFVHDCALVEQSSGDWGATCTHFPINVTWERVFTNRIDIHYFYTGYFNVKNCTVFKVNTAGGNGSINIEGCQFINNEDQNFITHRWDVGAISNGTVRVKDCSFYAGKTWSRIFYSDKKDGEALENATLPNGTKYILDNVRILNPENFQCFFMIRNCLNEVLEKISIEITNSVVPCQIVRLIYEEVADPNSHALKSVTAHNCDIEFDNALCAAKINTVNISKCSWENNTFNLKVDSNSAKKLIVDSSIINGISMPYGYYVSITNCHVKRDSSYDITNIGHAVMHGNGMPDGGTNLASWNNQYK